ncbi:MAG: (Fe-S)-binding protein [Dehalococcoidia bacterium]|nr:(Fe-S)-binding protein [Dehalococcoidia bacterium]
MVPGNRPNLMDIVERVEQNECSLTPMEMRLRLVRDVMGLPVDQPAEYALITGCRGPSSFYHIAYLGALLRHLGTSYTLLSVETCCGESYIRYLNHDKPDEIAAFDGYAKQLSSRNIERIRKLGISKIIAACAGCMTRYVDMWSDSGLEILYYTQYLLPRLAGLRLEGEVNFYEGCHALHRTPRYKIDTTASRELIGAIEGLTVAKTLPNYCCRTVADKVFAAADRQVIVTPTSCCAGILRQKRKEGAPLVKPLTQVLCQALGIHLELGST